ncbi:pyridoxal-phosphate dependent enzyme [Streptomyces orinoci]|uniref:Pyridoxal-phosphate dependent enzyme n=1 Tax=Streptomyces orinoci TaxID=67339 RepID=A0ABV3K634_STRON|nr:pyridoxal-phosphate dependent enzyme [Streptomyces orinoci]
MPPALPPLHCPRCDAEVRDFAGCAVCRAEGVGVNPVPPAADLSGLSLDSFPGGPWGWPTALPVPGPPVTLGEGATPNIRIPLEDSPRGGEVVVKYEGANPTGSHKDRAMAVGVAAAVASGADTVAVSSSGNAAAAAAAYAGRAGLRCVVFTTPAVPGPLRAQIDALGGVRVVCGDHDTRQAALRESVERFGWYPLTCYTDPSPGSNSYANEGYKSVAYELARDFGESVSAVVVPTSRGDLLSGIARGFAELRSAGLLARTPRLVTAEPDTAAPLAAALAQRDRARQERTRIHHRLSPAFSLGERTPAWQALNALWQSDGAALALPAEEYLAERQVLAGQGLFLEASSAVAVRAARHWAHDHGGLVIALGTATGLKDTSALPAPGEAVDRIPELAELAIH